MTLTLDLQMLTNAVAEYVSRHQLLPPGTLVNVQFKITEPPMRTITTVVTEIEKTDAKGST